MANNQADIISMQLAAYNAPLPERTQTATNPLLPDTSILSRLAHFPEEVYDLRETSHLRRLMEVLLGDPGVGQNRKRLLLNRLSQNIQGIHFYDLDRFYGALFGVRRSVSEILSIDPATQLASPTTWAESHTKDASYRSRITQFARSISFGGSPTGMELVAEALLSVDCDVYESFIQADASYQTNGEIEAAYTTYAPMEGLYYGTLEGEGLPRLAGNDRRTFTIRPKRPISASDAYELGRVLDRIKPADTRFTIETDGIGVYQPTPIKIATADSNLWEVITSVIPTHTYQTTYTTVPAPVPEVPVPVLLPPWAGGQGMEWSYATDIVGTSAFSSQSTHRDDGHSYRGPDGKIKGYGFEFFDLAFYLNGHYDPHAFGQSNYPWTQVEHADSLFQDASYFSRFRFNAFFNAGPFYGWQPSPDYYKIFLGRMTYPNPLVALPAQRQVAANGTTLDFMPHFALIPDRLAETTRLSRSGTLSSNAYAGASRDVYPELPLLRTHGMDLSALLAMLHGTDGPTFSLEESSDTRFWMSPSRYSGRHLTGYGTQQVLDHWTGANNVYADNDQNTFQYSVDISGSRDNSFDTLYYPDGKYRIISVSHPFYRNETYPIYDETPPISEILEFRLSDTKPINSVTFEVSHFPHHIEVLVGDEVGNWDVVAEATVNTSSPARFPRWSDTSLVPWQHSAPNHFLQQAFKFPTPVQASRLRVQLTRIQGNAPQRLNYGQWEEFAYSLAVRNFEAGFIVNHVDALPVPVVTAQPTVIATTRDILGSRVEYSLRQERANDMVDGLTPQWTCEPQPVSYAVVNLYLDVTDASGNPVVVDRLFLDPTHPGPHMSIYYSNDIPGTVLPSKTDTEFFNAASWTPIGRDYFLQKGFVQVPPTSARYLKLEFTSLTAEPFDPVVPLTRKVRLFPSSLADQLSSGTGAQPTSAQPSGLSASQQIDPPSYRDASLTLRNASPASQNYSPAEVVLATDLSAATSMREDSWVFGFQPWHQGARAPRFTQVGPHRYDIVEVTHNSKVGYSVGLNDIRVYRQDFGADDDTQVYVEHFYDFSHLQAGFTFTFNPSALTTETSTNSVAQSTPYASRHEVRALQFATQQTPPIQLIPDDDFRDPANAASRWNSPDGWHTVGDAFLVYSPDDHSVVNVRSAQPIQQPLTPRNPSLVQPIDHPVFATRQTQFINTPATQGQVGGIESPPLAVSPRGRIHAAVRVTPQTALTSPLILQITNNADGTVLASMPITSSNGETVERVLSYLLVGVAAVRVSLVQQGVSNDQWKLDTLSLFDEGLVWDFSVNGGSDWVQAVGVMNNANGLLTFPEPGNQLVWRVTGYRAHMAVSSLKIRPEYYGVQNARYNGAQRGPNVSIYDSDVPIQDDPMFNDWSGVIPKGWYTAFKRFPSLPIGGMPNITEFARFYGRPITDTVSAPTDTAAPFKVTTRTGVERMDALQPVSDGVARSGSIYRRAGSESLATPTEAASPLKVKPYGRMVNRIIHPTS